MRRAHVATLALSLALASGCGSADSGSLADPSFDDWCGPRLCSWRSDQGSIASTATWHKQDRAVAFLDTPTQISQRIAPGSIGCFLLETIADVDPEALLSVQVDFNDDGLLDFDQLVPAVRWKSVPFVVRAPLDYANVRFIVRKEGSGRAVLAQLRVEPRSECSGAPLTLADGSLCSQDAVCRSGHCFAARCAQCTGESCTSLAPLRSFE